MHSIDLTQEEARVLLNMLNIAVMAKGLEAAEAGLHFKAKIEEAFKPKPPAPVVAETEEGHA
jgi:hypothetical protein